MATALGVVRGVGIAGVEHLAVLVVGDLGSGDFAAMFANHLEGIPVAGAIGLANFFVGFAHQMGVFEEAIDRRIQLARSIQIPQVINLGPHTQILKHIQKFAHEIFGVITGAIARRGVIGRGHIAEGPAQIALKLFPIQIARHGVQRVVIIHAVDEFHGLAGLFQSAIDRVVNHDSPQGANVNTPRWRFGIVNDLWTLCVGGDFICPETHGGGAVMTR